ncbi:PAAR-like protein [Pedobacter caeni]|uniref:DUF4280 domain-containing protein n=1 Tax=Pedobacter caeni TaxID=288992 RepID=A0A1M4YV50_9SPHI|nr:PAAR-like protein [Pedobacter caeni]SHF09704.1 protein of unknown function [Pedobacter caeni]
MAKKYIPDNSCLMCDKGSAPCKLKVTHHNNTKIYGEFLASEMDMVPGENILPMGTCSVTGGACVPDPIYWDKTNQGVKVNGYKLLFDDANLLCKKGGKVSVTFNTPTGFFGNVADFGSGYDTGLGMAAQWLNYKDAIDYNQRGTVYDVENGKLSLVRDNSPSDRRRSGNYGEMKDNIYHRENNWRDIRSEHPNMNIDKNTAAGIDGAYERNGTYRETDGKYGTARIADTNNGKELSQRWTENHLDNGAIANPKDEAGMRRANNNGTLEREVIYTDKTEGSGSKKKTRAGLSSETHASDGSKATRGQFEMLESKPPSKAAQMMNSARSSARNSAAMKALADSRLSQKIQASKGATKANNALWKATQFMESTPALKTTGKVIGRGAIVVGIVMDAVSIGSAYAEEGEFGDKTQQATGSAIGGAAGAWAGAEIGALIGTAICPGVGTVIGGVLGGIIGGLAGSKAGSSFLDSIF